MLKSVSPSSSPTYPYWLVTDLDGTYFIEKDQLAQRRLNQRVQQLHDAGTLGLIYTTGRSRGNYLAIADHLVKPDYVITGDGRYIRHDATKKSGYFTPWEAEHKGFQTRKATAVMGQVAAQFQVPLLPFKQAFPDRVNNPAAYPETGQISRFIPITQVPQAYLGRAEAFIPVLVQALETQLKAQGVEAAVVSNLDNNQANIVVRVKPPKATKDQALDFLLKWLGIHPEQLMIAGDNYNDETMLQKGVRAIVAGNKPALESFRQRMVEYFQSRYPDQWKSHLYVSAQEEPELKTNNILGGLNYHLSQLNVQASPAVDYVA